MSLRNLLKKKLAVFLETNPENIHLFFKGRVALWSLLKAAGIQNGDEVILQGFTCIAVPNAIMLAGGTPVYVDIDKSSFNMTLEDAKKKITAKTRVLLIQNTFGLSSQAEEFLKFCNDKNILLIEDCTHGFGGYYKKIPNGKSAHAAFYSTQWSKPFTSGLGGFALINDSSRFPKRDSLTLPHPPLKKNISLLIQNCIYSLIPSKSLLSRLKSVYHSLYARGWISGSSTPDELLYPPKVQNEAWTLGSVQTFFALLRLRGLQANIQQRMSCGLKMNALLKMHELHHYPDSILANHAFLKLPILCKPVKRQEAIRYVHKKYNYVPGDWFTSPLYPVLNGDAWNYSSCPKSEEICKEIINLPSDEPALCEAILTDTYFLEHLKKASS